MSLLLSISQSIQLNGSLGSLVLSGKLPSLTFTKEVSTQAGQISLSGQAPSVEFNKQLQITPRQGLILTGYAPSIGTELKEEIAVSEKKPVSVQIVTFSPTTDNEQSEEIKKNRRKRDERDIKDLLKLTMICLE